MTKVAVHDLVQRPVAAHRDDRGRSLAQGRLRDVGCMARTVRRADRERRAEFPLERALIRLPPTAHAPVRGGRIHDENDVSRHGRPEIPDGRGRGPHTRGPPPPSAENPSPGLLPSVPLPSRRLALLGPVPRRRGPTAGLARRRWSWPSLRSSRYRPRPTCAESTRRSVLGHTDGRGIGAPAPPRTDLGDEARWPRRDRGP